MSLDNILISIFIECLVIMILVIFIGSDINKIKRLLELKLEKNTHD